MGLITCIICIRYITYITLRTRIIVGKGVGLNAEYFAKRFYEEKGCLLMRVTCIRRTRP